MKEVKGVYYDGQSARARIVTLSVDGDMLVTLGDGIQRREPLAALYVTEAIGNTPRLIQFVGGASCEVADGAALTTMLGRHGQASSPVAAWDRSWRIVLTAVVFIAVLAVVSYRYGLPALARTAADRLPASALDTLSLQIQRVLDRSVFDPTEVPEWRRAQLSKAFEALQLPAETKGRLRLNFRRSTLGANAMALPSGAIFVTDDLVAMTDDNRVVMAVIAHEAGHVHRRHGLRQIIQSTIMGALVTWYIGDVSALTAAAPSALLQAKYSRDLEREADAYAAEVLTLNGMSASLLADALVALERTNGKRGDAGPLEYLLSHPATAQRIEWLRAK